jgi:nucleotide-binding universal stress UspA family protein
MSKNIYLVLHDFTPVGDAALDYAMSISSNLSAEIKLVNLVSDKKDVAGSKAKLDAIISKVQNLNGNSITSLARVGSIFEDIAVIVKEEKANLIVMGTHGAKGFQKIFGSYAMKVVKSSDVPFFVIQKETKPKNIKKNCSAN